MDGNEKGAVFVVKLLASGTIAWFLGLHHAYQAMVVLTIIDFFSGLTVAGVKGEITSHRMWVGLLKKLIQFGVVFAVYICTAPFDITVMGLSMAAWTAVFYAIQEGTSIVENCDKAGIPIPGFLRAAIKKAKTNNVISGILTDKLLALDPTEKAEQVQAKKIREELTAPPAPSLSSTNEGNHPNQN